MSIGIGIRRYTSQDYEALSSWYHKRNVNSVQESYIPKIGFVIEGIAMGFLMQTDANLGILEPFISNPEASKEDRDMALNVILELLTRTAKEMNYKGVFGFSTSLPMIRRALKQGFIINEVDSSTVFKELN